MIGPDTPSSRSPLSNPDSAQAPQVSGENAAVNDLEGFDVTQYLDILASKETLYQYTGSDLALNKILTDKTLSKDEKYTRITNLTREITQKVDKDEKLWEQFRGGKIDQVIEQLGWKQIAATKGAAVVLEKSPETQFFETFIQDLIEFPEQYTFSLEENNVYVQKNGNFVSQFK